MKKLVTLSDNSQVYLRSPQKNDVQAFNQLVNKLVAEDTYFLVQEPISLESTKFIQQYFDDPEGKKHRLILVEDADKIVGWVNLDYLNDRSPHVRELGIILLAAYRGKGLGTILLEEAIRQAKEMNVDIITLHTAEANTIATRLYERFGFKLAGMVPEKVIYHGKKMGHLWMYLRLK